MIWLSNILSFVRGHDPATVEPGIHRKRGDPCFGWMVVPYYPIVLWLHDQKFHTVIMFAAEHENIPGRKIPVFFYIHLLTFENFFS